VQTFTVYEQRVGADTIDERASGLVFVKEGLAFWALVAPAIWLLVHRVWWALLAYLVLSIAVLGGLRAIGADEQAIVWGGLILNLIFAYEARDLYRGSLERKGYALIGVVSGRNLEECERRFLQEWLPEARGQRSRLMAMSGAGTPLPGNPSRVLGEPVIGMFPAHGG
jgi:Protein of unknown function (DUF2628)